RHSDPFLLKQRNYMPIHHRRWLESLQQTYTVFNTETPMNKELSPTPLSGLVGILETKEVKAKECRQDAKEDVALKGTGDTDFVVFLKEVTSETRTSEMTSYC